MGHNRIVHVLPEEGLAAETVQRDAVGDFDHVQLLFLGEDLIDVGFKTGVGV